MSARAFDVFAAAEEAPDQDAVVHAGRVLSNAELAALVAGRAEALLAAGADTAPRAAITAQADLPGLVEVLALLALRVPLVMVHPRLTAPERARILELAAPVWSPPPHGALEPAASVPARPAPSLQDPVAVFFTSGTTGVPKGAVLGRGALLAAAEASARNLGWQDDDRWLMSIPPAHIGGFSILTRALAARRAVVLPSASESFDVQAFLREVAERRVTLASLVPTQLVRLLRDAPEARPPACLRAVLVGGAAADPDLVAAARAAGYPVLTTYGLTEACAQVATERPGERAPRGSVGRPLVPGSVRVVEGRIQVGGPALMSGYLGRGREGFTEDGWLETQDLGALDAEGFVFVKGRAAELIVSGGENVYPEEVEASLRALPQVGEALVFGIEDAEWGQRVAAAIVPAPGARCSPRALEEAARASLAGFKRPRAWAIVQALPRTAAGKPDRLGAAARLAGRLERV